MAWYLVKLRNVNFTTDAHGHLYHTNLLFQMTILNSKLNESDKERCT